MAENNKRNVLVTGANGQLGNCLRDLSPEYSVNHNFYFTDIDTLDITDLSAVEEYVNTNSIDVIINAAAYTAVDKAEDEVEKAFLINRDAVGILAKCAKRHGALLIHVSTDYVFDGSSAVPHKEDEEKAPKSVYGASKAAGEEELERIGCSAVVVRTSWLYSEYGGNFVKTMLRLGRERESLNVVYDQVGGPTYAGDLARALLEIMTKDFRSNHTEYYHFANEGVCSWFDFATAIMEISGLKCKINPILASEYPSKAVRPFYSVFDLSKIRQFLEREIPYWRNSLILTINKLELFEKKS